MGKILLVQIANDIGETLKRYLSRFYDVIDVATGEEALVYLKEQPFDVIVCDTRLLALGGASLAMEAQKIQPKIIGIVLTFYPFDEKYIIVGVLEIDVPVDLKKLVKIIDEVIAAK